MLFLFTLDIKKITPVEHFLSIMARHFKFRALKWSKWFTAVKRIKYLFWQRCGLFDTVSKKVIAAFTCLGQLSCRIWCMWSHWTILLHCRHPSPRSYPKDQQHTNTVFQMNLFCFLILEFCTNLVVLLISVDIHDWPLHSVHWIIWNLVKPIPVGQRVDNPTVPVGRISKLLILAPSVNKV